MTVSHKEGLSLFLYSPKQFKDSLLYTYLPTEYKTPSVVLVVFSKLLLFCHVHFPYDNTVNVWNIWASLSAIMYIIYQWTSNEIALGLPLKLKLCKLTKSSGYDRHSQSRNTGKCQWSYDSPPPWGQRQLLQCLQGCGWLPWWDAMWWPCSCSATRSLL